MSEGILGGGRYSESERWLERALRSIPLGAQTFSKSKVQYPLGAAPQFLARGRGARVWDVDDNEYVDLVCGLASVLLGYCDPDVDRAVREQLESGITFSLSHSLETQVAEAVIEMVPCAEQVRFGKNGSDATAAAVRLSRAVTRRDHVAVCGYHGWQDWYIGSTSRWDGVPESTRSLTQTFSYNDLESLTGLFAKHEYAAVILEPMNTVEPAEGFLESVADATREHGALLVFDETVTGFRFARGGAQELFGVTPDLATFGKGLANGLPLSVVAGAERWMSEMETIFFSTTFGGETLSLAGALAVLEKICREPVLATIADRGRDLLEGTQASLVAHGLDSVIHTSGHPAWSFLHFSDVAATGSTDGTEATAAVEAGAGAGAAAGGYDTWQIKTLFLQECMARGVLTLGSHNISYALTEADVAFVVDVYGEVFQVIREAIDRGDLEQRLRCEVLRPVFEVRPRS